MLVTNAVGTVIALASKFTPFHADSSPQVHPIHLHGHDFWILEQKADAKYDPMTPPKNFHDLPRRDVAMLPLNGYLLIAFQTDNPGAWLLHCHIGWHASQGFALTFLENSDQIKSSVNADRLDANCEKWKGFAKEKKILQNDSGI